MKNKEFYKLLKKNQSNSGFTLIELLVGLVMSIFVIGALGFGLMTVLQTNQRENSKVKARTENSRALDFISDEVRRARNIETDTTFNAPGFDASADKTVVLALDIPEISSTSKIVYYLRTANENWKGPQVLYRWGPPLDANGNYPSDPDGNYDPTIPWTDQALIDGINTTPVTNPCSTGTVSTVNPTGFYACISLQDSTKAYNPISLIPDPLDPSKNIQNPDYNPRNTAQLFLTGQTKTATGVNDSQTNDTQVVARARTRAANATDKNKSINWSTESLGGDLACDSNGNWDMQTTFSNDVENRQTQVSDPKKDINWLQTKAVPLARQAQPIIINPSNPLSITSAAVNGANCNSTPNIVKHEINFNDPMTFNGDQENSAFNCSYVKPEPGNERHKAVVQFFKKGSSLPTASGGFDVDGDGQISFAEGSKDQPSLGLFLFKKGLAIPEVPGADVFAKDTKFKMLSTTDEIKSFLASDLGSNLKPEHKSKFRVLGNDQRIVAFEVGQKHPDEDNDGNSLPNNPGFDLQDNIFVVTSDVFKTEFTADKFGLCPS